MLLPYAPLLEGMCWSWGTGLAGSALAAQEAKPSSPATAPPAPPSRAIDIVPVGKDTTQRMKEIDDAKAFKCTVGSLLQLCKSATGPEVSVLLLC